MATNILLAYPYNANFHTQILNDNYQVIQVLHCLITTKNKVTNQSNNRNPSNRKSETKEKLSNT